MKHKLPPEGTMITHVPDLDQLNGYNDPLFGQEGVDLAT